MSEFVIFRLLPNDDGGWLDPHVAVGAMVRPGLPSEQFARFLAERLAKAGGPIAVAEIFPGHGRQIVAVIGDEVPPLGRVQ